MKREQQDFLNLVRLPGIINADEVGYLLGITAVHVSILVSKRFLNPLGGTSVRNAPRRFSADEISKLAVDREQLDKLQRALSSHWRCRNGTDSVANKASKKMNNRNGVVPVMAD